MSKESRKALRDEIINNNLAPKEDVNFQLLERLMTTYDRYYEARLVYKALGDDAKKMHTMLDFGCGAADYAMLFARNDWNIWLCDIAEFEPALIYRFYREGFSPFYLVEEEIQQVADDTFDLIVCGEVLEHVPDAMATLRTLIRQVRPGGYFFTTNFPFRDDGDYWHTKGHNSATPKHNAEGRQLLDQHFEPAINLEGSMHLLKKKGL